MIIDFSVLQKGLLNPGPMDLVCRKTDTYFETDWQPSSWCCLATAEHCCFFFFFFLWISWALVLILQYLLVSPPSVDKSWRIFAIEHVWSPPLVVKEWRTARAVLSDCTGYSRLDPKLSLLAPVLCVLLSCWRTDEKQRLCLCLKKIKTFLF